VIEHQGRVAQIYCEVFGIPRAEVLYYCLHHDMGEQFAGDVPFGGKHRVEGYGAAVNEAERLGLGHQQIELPQMREDEWKRFKICDLLEMYEFCFHEFMMGNQYAAIPMRDTREIALKMADELYQYVKVDEWMKGVKIS